jgi:hypothetical protein
MRKRLTLGATLAVAAIGFGASSASAATLYTTSAHTTAVGVGATFTASTPSGAGTWNYEWTSKGIGMWERCNSASYTFKVTKNSLGVFKAETTGGAFNTCEFEALAVNAPATLEITGSSITVGTGKAWLGSTLKNVGVKELGINRIVAGNLVSATGNPPANGVSAQQPAAAAPVSVVLSNAGTLVSELVGPTNVTANYTLTGAAASYSLG